MTTDIDTQPATAAPADLDARREKREHDQAIKAHNDAARSKLRFAFRSVNQGEWLQVTRLLDLTRAQISEDDNLALAALAYVLAKRDHGYAEMEEFLAMTDVELAQHHGFLVPDDEDTEGATD